MSAKDKKAEVIETGYGRAIVSDKVRSHANDPFFVKKVEGAKEFMRKHPFPDHLKK
ncbi:hypothetical protein [Mucilaginibacter gotjawali]|uniref:Uncharacterized protein n=2 Tax=Mucilaginibacter gotjawali TaxID=1550579 RepID=A0A110B158_9SPHI|nr:hypothetical protein [Mucilaginibacter gotjawali]MBB3059102.1 hypothetical protein [Mucilaginibacter gotjawali]BAU52826.1 hypothetical protein MgSA37_00990 [Mucilaginibacter gotjawali]